MRVTYILPTTEFGGGIKVALEHAELLEGRGHQVSVVAPEPRPEWTSFRGAFIDRLQQAPREALGCQQDLVVATFWTTVREALDLDLGPVAHFCQGYEGGLEHLAGQREGIEATYSLDLPTLVVTPALGERLRERFGRQSQVVPPPLDPRFKPLFRWRPRAVPRIVLPGIFEAPVKGVAWGLRAANELNALGIGCVLVRVSMLEMSAEESAIREADVYLQGVSPSRVAAELRQSDLLLLPSREDEGFGLPLLEAMASKVPAVAAEIGSTRFMAPHGVELVPFGDAVEMARRAAATLRSAKRWRRMRRLAYAESRRFSRDRIATMLEKAVDWAASRGQAEI